MRYKAAGAAVDAVYSCSGKLTCTRYEYGSTAQYLIRFLIGSSYGPYDAL